MLFIHESARWRLVHCLAHIVHARIVCFCGLGPGAPRRAHIQAGRRSKRAFARMQHACPELMAAPPPSRWRSGPELAARECNIAWRGAEAKHDRYLNRRVHDLVHILRGDEGTGQYWADGILPAKHPVPPNHDFEMLACEGQPDLRTTKKQTQPACDAWWPKSERGCVVYVIGVGDEWSFPRRAKANNCSVYAFDPTTDLRRRQEEAARRQGFKYYFRDSAATQRSSSANSYGAVEVAARSLRWTSSQGR